MADNSRAASLSCRCRIPQKHLPRWLEFAPGIDTEALYHPVKGQLGGQTKMILYSLGVREAGVAYDSEGESPISG